MYKKTIWKDEITNESGQILQEGTPLSANNFNKIEDELVKSSETINTLKDNVGSNTNDISNMKESISQNKPIVITDDTPVGTIIWWSSEKINKLDVNIWKVCNGQVVKKEECPELYELFKDNPNYTVSSAEFALPNLLYNRRFIRSVGSDYNVGFVEEDTIKSHNHMLVNNANKRINLTPDFDGGVDDNSIDSFHYARASANKANNVSSWQASSFTSYTGESETRPRNMSLVPLIKCKNITQNMKSVATEWNDFKEGVGISSERNGYCKLPNGMIHQWGCYNQSFATGKTGFVDFTIVYPIQFKYKCLNLQLTPMLNQHDIDKVTHMHIQETNSGELNLDNADVKYHVNSQGAVTVKVNWYAIGF